MVVYDTGELETRPGSLRQAQLPTEFPAASQRELLVSKGILLKTKQGAPFLLEPSSESISLHALTSLESHREYGLIILLDHSPLLDFISFLRVIDRLPESEHNFTASQVPNKGLPDFLHWLSL